MRQDTIAAIASGLTQSGIGVIRVSGDHSAEICDGLFRWKNKRLRDQPTHTIHYGYVYHGEDKLDEALAMVMWAPRSYTGEDVVEIQCHGGPLVMRRILETLLSLGARLAEPGEFSRRAFLNGRMDLSQAEAVMEMIQAENDYAIHASVQQISGSLSREIRSMREVILENMARIEAALDDPEHLSLDGYEEVIADRIEELLDRIGHLKRTSEEGKKLAEGIHTVILGRPNAGKSSLLNQLLGEERAIVTDVAGTTRDILQESIYLGGFSLKLVDTAGIRQTADAVEKIGVERAKQQAEQADLLLYVVDSSEQLDENDRQIISLLSGKNALVIMNKTDLEPVLTEKELSDITKLPVIPISAKDGSGIDLLKNEVIRLFDTDQIRHSEQVIITNVRHREALLEAEQSLKMVKESLEMQMPEDFLTIDLMAAYASLGKIIGEEVGEDLVNEIFSKFCMGK